MKEWIGLLFKPLMGHVLAPGTSLLSLDGFLPPDFVHGIEILNDDKTPMKFVVSILEKHVGLDRASATRAMLQIHRKGGLLVRLASASDASRIAQAVTREANDQSHPLLCRAVSAQQNTPADAAKPRG
jgi:ATP-dependent Clp protease adapter protein ClpS